MIMIRKSILFAITILITANIAEAVSTENSVKDACQNITTETIVKNVPADKVEIIQQKPVFDMCEVVVRVGGDLTVVYAKNNDYVIAGDMFVNKSDLSVKTVNEIRKIDFMKKKQELNDATAIIYKPQGEIKHTVYMFVDTHCPYCQKLEAKIKDIADENQAEIRVLFFSMRGRQHAIDIVCNKYGIEKLSDKAWLGSNPNTFKPCSEGTAIIDKSYKLGRDLGLNAVPTCFVDNGTMVSGFNVEELSRALK
jgi:thiol:disulfide interchange protein DsbC